VAVVVMGGILVLQLTDMVVAVVAVVSKRLQDLQPHQAYH
jgi:hypothetical protein